MQQQRPDREQIQKAIVSFEQTIDFKKRKRDALGHIVLALQHSALLPSELRQALSLYLAVEQEGHDLDIAALERQAHAYRVLLESLDKTVIVPSFQPPTGLV